MTRSAARWKTEGELCVFTGMGVVKMVHFLNPSLVSFISGNLIMSSLWPDKPVDYPLTPALIQAYQSLLRQEQIPLDDAMEQQLESLFWPMAVWLAQQHGDNTLVIGINGAQGSGKSTLAKILETLLRTGLQKRVASFSIDDIYLTRNERQKLARDVHPLLKTRGVPGTHDVVLGQSIIHACRHEHNDAYPVPVFDKASDDRADRSRWKQVETPVDILLFEGWCVGSVPETEEGLDQPVNRLEQEEDEDGVWREYVNQQLAGPYTELYAQLDYLFLMKVPSMDKVYEWRLLQEKKLRESHQDDNGVANIMSDDEVRRFIMHYERITRANLALLPQRADAVLHINDEHQIEDVDLNL